MASHGPTASALAREPGVPPDRIAAILNGGRAVTAAAAAPLLARRFGTSAGFWTKLRSAHALQPARAATGEAA